MELKDKIRGARKKKGLSQRELSEVAGVTQATISRIEAGKILELRSDTIVGLCNGLGLTPNFLLDWCEKEERQCQEK